MKIPKLTKEQLQKCEGVIAEEKLLKALKKMPNNKSPGNDGIAREFYEAFWDDLKTPFLLIVNKAFNIRELSTSHKQAVIKLIEKKDKDKRLIKAGHLFRFSTLTQNWFQKLAECLKTALLSLISSNQRACLNGRFISEGGCLISVIFEVSDLLKLKGFLLTVDIEKASDSVNHNFLLNVLENYGFSQDFLNQEYQELKSGIMRCKW